MKHFDHCQCAQCRKSPLPVPQAPCGFLMQQIVSQGEAHPSCQSYCLSLSPLPRILVPPYTVRNVSVCGDIALSEDQNACCRPALSATLPLSVTLCDQSGNTHTAQAFITVSVPMQTPYNCNCTRYVAEAAVRLCRGPVCFTDPMQVDICLDVCVKVYGVKPQVVYTHTACASACPQLPLYPPPGCR
ncbi:MAG: hypothetical protein IKW00_05800 [Clostridia bacterium]|nr:hypothetical protein [Clostridia bacterium]